MNRIKETYIIAEAGVNHNGSLDLARELVNVASDAGADAVKFQTFKADNMVSRKAPKAEYQNCKTDSTESHYEMIKKLELSESAHIAIVKYCEERKIQFLSTPFDQESMDFLVGKLNIPRLKLSSGEITNSPLLLKAARAKKPVILSTGMSTLGEVEDALGVLAFGYIRSDAAPSKKAFREAYCTESGQEALQKNVVLLHCTSEYPAPFSDVNLRAMETLESAFGLPVGLSDHTAGIVISIAAVARGARIIEKHFTMNRALPGPDHRASLEPSELRDLVKAIRQVEASLGSNRKIPYQSELKNIAISRKSLVAMGNIKKGDQFTEKNLTIKRPGHGMSPMLYWHIIGSIATHNYSQDDLIEE